MPFPISVNVGDGSAAVVAVSSAAIALIFLLRPIIKKVKRPEDLRFFGICSLAGVLAVLVAGVIATILVAGQDAAKQASAPIVEPSEQQLAQLTPRDCEELKAKVRASKGAVDPQQQKALQACANASASKSKSKPMPSSKT